MATTPCDKVQIKYKGDGVQKLFTFPFTYLAQDDVIVSIWDDTIKDYKDVASTSWFFANATTVEFTDAPPAPPAKAHPTDPDVFNIRIYRRTDIDRMEAAFYPGSAIRAEDLNDNFDQLRFAIEEGRCTIPGEVYKYLSNKYWNKVDETIDEQEQLNGEWVDGKQNDDKHIATAKAISRRLDVLLQDAKPNEVALPGKRQPAKLWVDNGELVLNYWEPSADAWVTLANSGPAGTIKVGTVTSLPTGTTPVVTNVGSASSAVLDFGLPQGPQGMPGVTGPAGPAGGNLTHVGVAPVTVSTAGTTVTYGWDITTLATLA